MSIAMVVCFETHLLESAQIGQQYVDGTALTTKQMSLYRRAATNFGHTHYSIEECPDRPRVTGRDMTRLTQTLLKPAPSELLFEQGPLVSERLGAGNCLKPFEGYGRYTWGAQLVSIRLGPTLIRGSFAAR